MIRRARAAVFLALALLAAVAAAAIADGVSRLGPPATDV